MSFIVRVRERRLFFSLPGCNLALSSDLTDQVITFHIFAISTIRNVTIQWYVRIWNLSAVHLCGWVRDTHRR
jgi:hypothetical protein